MVSSIHSASNEGFKKAFSYEKHRPDYPPIAVETFLERLQVSGVEKARILDLGAGTGKFTAVLSQRIENFEIVAVEPHKSMRNELEKKDLRGVTVADGEAINMMGLTSQNFDAVVVAQVRFLLILLREKYQS